MFTILQLMSTIGRPQIPYMTGQQVGAAAMKATRSATSSFMAGARRVNAYVAENHWSLKLLSMLGFAGVLGFSIAAVAGYKDENYDGTHKLMNFYLIFFSLADLISEAGDNWPLLGKMRSFMFRQFGFLRHNLGRGLYNIFFGVLFSTLWNFPQLLVGIYVIFVGLLYIAAHRRGTDTATTGMPAQGTAHVQMRDDIQ